MPYVGEDYLKLLDLTGEGAPQKYNDMLKDYHRLIARRNLPPDYREMTEEEVRAHLTGFRAFLLKSLGLLEHPDTSVPEHFFAGGFDRDGYSVRKIGFYPRPKRGMTALLYRPEKPLGEPGPAVLCVHGHAALGKAQTATQQRCIGLAKRGFTVLCVDASGHGERRAVGHVNFSLFASGITHQALLVHDNMRALDLLASFDGVDPKRMGVTGSSGGGNQSMFLGALDDRIAACVPTASVCAFDDHMANAGSYCRCEWVPGLVRHGDIGDILALIAPRSLLVLAGTRDRTFPAHGMRDSYLRARDAFEKLGAGDKITKHESYTPHAYSLSMREAMYRFFEERLAGVEKHSPENFPLAVENPAGDEINVLPGLEAEGIKLEFTSLEKETAVFCGNALGGEDHLARRFTGNPTGFRAELESDWTELFGEAIITPELPLVLSKQSRTFGSFRAECFVIESECGILVPCCIASKNKTPADAPLVAYLKRDGKDAVFFDRSPRELLDAGFRVLGIDVRGTGETGYGYFTEEESAVENAIITGRSLLAGRARDLSAVFKVLEAEGLISGTAGVWAADSFSLYSLLATFKDSRITAVAVEHGLLSLVSEEGFNERGIESLFVPGILKSSDLPQLFGACSPKPLMIINPVGAKGEAVGADDAEKALAWTAGAYSSMQAGGNLILRTGLPDVETRALAVDFFREKLG